MLLDQLTLTVMPDLLTLPGGLNTSWEIWVLLYFAALLMGVSKTGLPALSVIPISILALALPTKESVGIALLLFIVGDMVALFKYRSHVDWATLRGLLPSVATGVILGAIFLYFVNDSTLRRVLGGLIVALAMIGIGRWLKSLRANSLEQQDLNYRAWKSFGFGAASGWATMVANSAGPIMSLYLLSRGLKIKALLGTSAWFYFAVNVSKLPFAAGLGLITPQGLLLVVALIPGFLIGAALGIFWANRANQKLFDALVLSLSLVAGITLIIS